jgi:hypothetical protein
MESGNEIFCNYCRVIRTYFITCCSAAFQQAVRQWVDYWQEIGGTRQPVPWIEG